MAKATRIDLPYEPYEGSVRMRVVELALDPADEHQMKWVLDFFVHVPEDHVVGLHGAREAYNDAKNGRGARKCEATPKDAFVSIELFDPSGDGDEADPTLFIEDAKIRFVKYVVTDKDETLRARVTLPGLSIEHSTELLNCIGRACRFITKPTQVSIPSTGANRAEPQLPVN